MIDDLKVKEAFPIFQQRPELAYLDSAATTQRPGVVIEAAATFSARHNATVHRGLYDLATEATEAYEAVREQVRAFVNADSADEIIFTTGATAALNLVAHLEAQRLQPGDEIVLSVAEHHSNIVPWQRVAKQTGAKLVWLTIDSSYEFPLQELRDKLSERTAVVALAHISNVLGYVVPLDEIVPLAHAVGARVVLDAAQSAGRLLLNVRKSLVDYMAVSGHKMYGPMGMGWLYAREELLRDREPLVAGGGAIEQVSQTEVRWAKGPRRFEAGTPNVAGVVALGAAIDFIISVGLVRIWQHEQALVAEMLRRLAEVPGLTLFGPQTAAARAGIFSWQLAADGEALHSHDVAELANRQGVALRGGHNCAQPLLDALQVSEVTRASFGIYTTGEDIDRLMAVLAEVQAVFARTEQPARRHFA